MARANGSTTFFPWLMLLIGGASLYACVFLPPWLELRALRQEHADAQTRIADLEKRLAAATRQIEHMQSDPAYIERLARKEFGTETPGVEIIPVETRQGTVDEPAAAPPATPREELATTVERAAHTNPLVAVFVLDQTRPTVMAMSGVIVIIALVLLLRHRPA
jgi:cell division protein FtsB